MNRTWECTNVKHPIAWAEITYRSELDQYRLNYHSVHSDIIDYREFTKTLAASKSIMSRRLKYKSEWKETTK